MFWAGTHNLWKCDLSEVIWCGLQDIKIQTLTNQIEALKKKKKKKNGTLHNTKNVLAN